MYERGVRVLSAITLLATAAVTLLALIIAGVGVAGAAGWADDYRLSTPGPVGVGYQPTWGVTSGGEVCDPVRITDYTAGCYGFVMFQGGQKVVDDEVVQGEMHPQAASLVGDLALDPEGEWNPLAVTIVIADVVRLLVVAFALFCLWRLLRTTSRGEPFTTRSVAWLSRMGAVLVAWEFVEPLYWLVASPKALDWAMASYGPGPHIELASMEPGGPSLDVIAIGLLLLVLAQVFRRGVVLADEQRMTV